MTDSVTGTEGTAAADAAAAHAGQQAPGPATTDPGPAPLDVARTPTGDPHVDAALERLGDVDHLTTDGHAAVYEDVHQGLRDALAALDARPGPPAPPTPHDRRS